MHPKALSPNAVTLKAPRFTHLWWWARAGGSLRSTSSSRPRPSPPPTSTL